MKKKNPAINITRRDFFRQSACASIGTIGVVNTIANLRLMSAAMAACPNITDYKALICLYMGGGNDSDNMLIPYSGTERTNYENYRGSLAIDAQNLERIYPENESREFGFHPNMPDIATMFNTGNLAMVNNVGTLLYPFANRTEYLDGLVPAPPNLFGHNTQSTHWMSSVPDKAFRSGWGGRIAEMLHASYNTGSTVSMNVSLNGLNNFMTGGGSVLGQFAVDPNATSFELNGFGSAYNNALDGSGAYRATAEGDILKAVEGIHEQVRVHLMEEAYAKSFVDARASEEILTTTYAEAASTGVDLDTIFTNADTSLGKQLKTVARIMAGRGCMGNKRQIFFVKAGGYDTHGSMLPAHADLMTELNSSMKAFDEAIQALGLLSNTMLFTASEFGRTFAPNKSDASAGSDHGWGGHAFVYGGAVKGKNFYGTYPSLEVGGDNESTTSNRGRWVPTTSVDQYGAVVTKWLGADSNSLETIFPNLHRFDDPFSSGTANLDFVNFAI